MSLSRQKLFVQCFNRLIAPGHHHPCVSLTHIHTHSLSRQLWHLFVLKNGSDYCTAMKDYKQIRCFICFISPTMHSWMFISKLHEIMDHIKSKAGRVHFNLTKIWSSWSHTAHLHGGRTACRWYTGEMTTKCLLGLNEV